MALMLRPLRHLKNLHEEEQSSLAVKLRLTPTATERTILGPDSMVKKFSDGIIYFTTLGERELISEVFTRHYSAPLARE